MAGVGIGGSLLGCGHWNIVLMAHTTGQLSTWMAALLKYLSVSDISYFPDTLHVG
jgi:hypothetical protein